MEKIAIVTGGNGQLGRVFVQSMLDLGYRVYAIDLNTDGATPIDGVELIKLDITKESEIRDFFSGIEAVDVLINNAGIGVFTPFEKRTAAEFKQVMDVNLLGTFLMSQSAIELMKKNGGGKIINIGSIYGSTSSDERIYGDSGRNNSEVYSVTKAGVIHLTKYMAAHFGRYNIQTNCISPGGINNGQSADFVKNYEYKTPMKRMGSPSDLTSTLAYLVSQDTSYTNGQNITVDGGFLAW